jgi:hypothetical protein
MATITNINGTSDTICKCGSWLKHWQNFSGESIPDICPSYNCYQTDLVGAHVQKANSIDKKWYIVPLCQKHNKSIGDLDILNSATLVSANKKETCER